jgi:hypothetical protein
VFGCGDLVEPQRSTACVHAVPASSSTRHPALWLFAQAADLWRAAPRRVTPDDRRSFLLAYIDLLVREAPAMYRASSHDRWIVNKLRALGGYYTRGFEGGSHLRVAVNRAPSVAALIALIEAFFASPEPFLPNPES